MPGPRVNLITLGVADVARSRAFYEALGFVASGASLPTVVFFDAGGVALALFGRSELAADASVPDRPTGFAAVSLAWNLESEAAVDNALAIAEGCGARIVKPAQKAPWGGYSGYFADPDDHLWEVAYNPVFALDADGRLSLPA
ncbi:MAG: VOC family protein [Hyphomicrobiaceae bacterium]